MKGKGNGTPQQCVENLLQLRRGEVPFERLKGVDTKKLDMPAGHARTALLGDIDWLIRTYEPRARLDDFDSEVLLTTTGELGLKAAMTMLTTGGANGE